MFMRATKNNKTNSMIPRNEEFKTLFVLSIMSLSLLLVAQSDSPDDATLLDSFINAKGYNSIIAFAPANIKQFWNDHSVINQNGLIKILLNDNKKDRWESLPFKIQLSNVNEAMDCKVDVISNNPLSFSVLNNNKKTVSESKAEDKFINNHIATAGFHMEDMPNDCFYLQFASTTPNILEIKRIILSFSTNKSSSYLASPGTLKITDSNCTCSDTITKDDENSFSVTGRRTRILSSNKILLTNNSVSNSVTVKNTGDEPTNVYLGYALYSREKKGIGNRNNYYKVNKVLKVLSTVEKGNSSVIVDSNPEWTKGSFLSLNAKEDLSDFPNFTFADGTIQDVKQIDGNHFEIVFDKAFSKQINEGTQVRVNSPDGSNYIYTASKRLLPGEKVTLSSTIQKDDKILQFTDGAICRGTYYIVPILRSSSVDRSKDNTVQISNYTVSF